MHPQRIGAVVQSVRMPACHAGGRGFESRPHRFKAASYERSGFFYYDIFWAPGCRRSGRRLRADARYGLPEATRQRLRRCGGATAARRLRPRNGRSSRPSRRAVRLNGPWARAVFVWPASESSCRSGEASAAGTKITP